jgi:3-oxoacyl-(acyl-carrier-protein) synthase
MESAGLAEGSRDAIPPHRIGLIVGSSRSANDLICEVAARRQTHTDPTHQQSQRIRPSEALNTAIASLSGSISHYLNIQGPASTISATCASSTVAIAQAADQLLLNRADIMIAGGAEAPLAPGVREMFEAAGILADSSSTENLCRAFDLKRSGSALGEGAAFFILEREDDAIRRGAIPLVELRGWISGMDPTGRAKVDESGGLVEQLISQLLEETATSATSVNLIHAHGTGTRLNDLAESSVIKKIWGQNEKNSKEKNKLPWVQASKALIGHTLGASGAIESCLTIEMIRKGVLPPSIHFDQSDPECGIELNQQTIENVNIQRALKISLGFWGHQSALLWENLIAQK